MDKYDERALREMAGVPEYWNHDLFTHGEVTMTDEGRVEFVRLGEQYRLAAKSAIPTIAEWWPVEVEPLKSLLGTSAPGSEKLSPGQEKAAAE